MVSGPRFKPGTSRIQSRNTNHSTTTLTLIWMSRGRWESQVYEGRHACSLFNNVFQQLRLYSAVWKGDKWWTENDFEGSGRGLILRYYCGIRLERLRKPRQTCQDSWYSGRDLNPGPPEYKAGVLTVQPWRWHWFECYGKRLRESAWGQTCLRAAVMWLLLGCVLNGTLCTRLTPILCQERNNRASHSSSQLCMAWSHQDHSIAVVFKSYTFYHKPNETQTNFAQASLNPTHVNEVKLSHS
jgi:hypothetical protein